MISVNDKYYSWAGDAKISKNGECGGTLTALLKFLVEEGKVDAVLALKKSSDIYDHVPVLTDDPDEIRDTAGSMHFATPNIPKIIAKYLNGANEMKIAVVTKPCDAMAIRELMKKGEINEDNLVMMGINCGGTFAPMPIRKMLEKHGINPDEALKEEISKGTLIFQMERNHEKFGIDNLEKEGNGRRTNCRRCEFNIPFMVDIAFGNWGILTPYDGRRTFIEVLSKRGAKLIEEASNAGVLNLEKATEESITLRNKMDKVMINLAQKWQKDEFTDLDGEFFTMISNHQDEFKRCIKCFGCIQSCPLCYREECTEKSEFSEGNEIPPNLLFHMERLINMVDSCVNCGQCEDACPVDIPLSKISHEINYRLRDIFDYVPGVDHKKPPFY